MAPSTWHQQLLLTLQQINASKVRTIFVQSSNQHIFFSYSLLAAVVADHAVVLDDDDEVAVDRVDPAVADHLVHQLQTLH
jgi:hypothetical protein